MKNRLLLKNIRQLLQVWEQSPGRVSGKDMQVLPILEDAWLAIEDGVIADYGRMEEFPGITDWSGLEVMDCEDRLVFPSWVDSHTHLVFASTREKEFSDRIQGLTYEEIAARGGGILNSAEVLRNTSEDDLYNLALERLHEVIAQGTGAIEIKSGYGLNLESELKMLRVANRLKSLHLIPVKTTLLAAHAIPAEFKNKRADYLTLIEKEIMPAVAAEHLADYADVFCERNYFTREETERLLNRAASLGMKPRVHANQLSASGGVQAAVACGALSADHLEFVGDEEIQLMLRSRVIPTVLPGAAYFLGLPLPPARAMIDAGLPLAAASDYNPGSSPSGNMHQVMSMLCVQYKLSPEEAFHATTLNTAEAIECGDLVGSISRGKKANLVITRKMNNYHQIPYHFGTHPAAWVLTDGKKHSIAL
jgi:imidazolonepropionase